LNTFKRLPRDTLNTFRYKLKNHSHLQYYKQHGTKIWKIVKKLFNPKSQTNYIASRLLPFYGNHPNIKIPFAVSISFLARFKLIESEILRKTHRMHPDWKGLKMLDTELESQVINLNLLFKQEDESIDKGKPVFPFYLSICQNFALIECKICI
jgi:hypothetical protein